MKPEIKKNNNKVEIKRNSVYLNNQRPDLILEQMADKIGNTIYLFKFGTQRRWFYQRNKQSTSDS